MELDSSLVSAAIEKGFQVISRENNGQPVTQSQALTYMLKQKTQTEAFPFLCLTWSIMQQPNWKHGFDSILKDGATKDLQDKIIEMWKTLPDE